MSNEADREATPEEQAAFAASYAKKVAAIRAAQPAPATIDTAEHFAADRYDTWSEWSPGTTTVADMREIIDDRDAQWIALLTEALDGWEDAAQYKGDFLCEKHGDAGGIERIRALVAKMDRT